VVCWTYRRTPKGTNTQLPSTTTVRGGAHTVVGANHEPHRLVEHVYLVGLKVSDGGGEPGEQLRYKGLALANLQGAITKTGTQNTALMHSRMQGLYLPTPSRCLNLPGAAQTSSCTW
jgi:hypothetical protein